MQNSDRKLAGPLLRHLWYDLDSRMKRELTDDEFERHTLLNLPMAQTTQHPLSPKCLSSPPSMPTHLSRLSFQSQ